ncbi:hypothetical protein PR048_028695 [Dryococelus australis]|uniref:Uncharacterized protein n=1 Tax=Dryococelus australis TaxID=614101 RepID=A0ABQ9GBA5_9NEOP|nr:hypothetical protein PR048_028695 [Dryococelus australis]
MISFYYRRWPWRRLVGGLTSSGHVMHTCDEELSNGCGSIGLASLVVSGVLDVAGRGDSAPTPGLLVPRESGRGHDRKVCKMSPKPFILTDTGLTSSMVAPLPSSPGDIKGMEEAAAVHSNKSKLAYITTNAAELLVLVFLAPRLMPSPMGRGATMAEQLACSPPTRQTRFNPQPIHSQILHAMPLVGGFSWGPPISPAPSFQCCSILTSITLIGSQGLAVNSHLNIFTHSLTKKQELPIPALPVTSTSFFTKRELHRSQANGSEIHARMRIWDKIPEKTCQPAAASGTIPTCENPGSYKHFGLTAPHLRFMTSLPPLLRCTASNFFALLTLYPAFSRRNACLSALASARLLCQFNKTLLSWFLVDYNTYVVSVVFKGCAMLVIRWADGCGPRSLRHISASRSLQQDFNPPLQIANTAPPLQFGEGSSTTVPAHREGSISPEICHGSRVSGVPTYTSSDVPIPNCQSVRQGLGCDCTSHTTMTARLQTEQMHNKKANPTSETTSEVEPPPTGPEFIPRPNSPLLPVPRERSYSLGRKRSQFASFWGLTPLSSDEPSRVVSVLTSITQKAKRSALPCGGSIQAFLPLLYFPSSLFPSSLPSLRSTRPTWSVSRAVSQNRDGAGLVCEWGQSQETQGVLASDLLPAVHEVAALSYSPAGSMM